MEVPHLTKLMQDTDRWNSLTADERATLLGIGYWDVFLGLWNKLTPDEQKEFKRHKDFKPLIVAYTNAYRKQTPENMDRLMTAFSNAIALLHASRTIFRV